MTAIDVAAARLRDAAARRTPCAPNPRFPWKSSTAMLTCGLTGTKKPYGVATTDQITIHPDPREPQRSRRIFAHHGAPREAGAAVLTCGNAADDLRGRSAALLVVSTRLLHEWYIEALRRLAFTLARTPDRGPQRRGASDRPGRLH